MLFLTEDFHLTKGISWPFLRAVRAGGKNEEIPACLFLPRSVASPNLCSSLLLCPLISSPKGEGGEGEKEENHSERERVGGAGGRRGILEHLKRKICKGAIG